MTPDEWERIKEVFDAALVEAPANRKAFLQAHCGDDTVIRNEVERLLAEHERASAFMDPPPPDEDRFALSGSQSVRTEARLIGQTISHYQILAKLGEGGMGIVYRAFDTQLLRPVAFKVLRHSSVADPESNRRFLREARAASALNHPNIAHVYEAGEAGDTPFIVMEHIDGRTLRSVLRDPPLDFARVLDFGLQSADAIAEAHERGIVHRDIKPSNIMITQRDQLKILDFGLAQVGTGALHGPPAVARKPAPGVWLEDGSPPISFHGSAEVDGGGGGLGDGITRITVSGQRAKRPDRFTGCLTTRQCKRGRERRV